MSVVIFGAGLVTRPLVKYLCEKHFKVTVASRTLSNAMELVVGCDPSIARAVQCDVTKDTELANELIQQNDVTISMLPYKYHKQLFMVCLEHKKHFLTTSYTQDFMYEYEKQIVESNMIVVNEAGLYPGLETASIMKIVDAVHKDKGKIESLTTYCGGLPTPESNTNPLGYKFSWAPRGVLLAERNPATYLEHGEVVTLPTRQLVLDNKKAIHVQELDTIFEGIANRDSLKFLKLYDIDTEAKTFIRGTLRYAGWSEIVSFFHSVDMFETDIDETLTNTMTYAQLLCYILSLDDTDMLPKYIECNYGKHIDNVLRFLGFYDETQYLITTKIDELTRLDVLAALMKTKMCYTKGEHDMIPIVNQFVALYPNGTKSEITQSAVFYGNDQGTAMENTVSLPVAVVAELILTKQFATAGLHILNKQELYEPVLDLLVDKGYEFTTKTTNIHMAIDMSSDVAVL